MLVNRITISYNTIIKTTIQNIFLYLGFLEPIFSYLNIFYINCKIVQIYNTDDL